MFDTNQIDKLYATLPAKSFRYAVSPTDIRLSENTQALLGESTRKLIRVLTKIIQAYVSKLEIKQILAVDAAILNAILEWRNQNKDDRFDKNLFRAVVRDGETYVLVSWDNNGFPRYSLREAFDGHVGAGYVYNQETSEPEYGVNFWAVGKNLHLDVFFPDRIEKYIRYKDNKFWEQRRDAPDEEWPIPWVDGAPLGIALVRFGTGVSELGDAVQIQRDINGTIIDLLAVSRNLAWPQRYIQGTVDLNTSTNAFGNTIVDPITGRPFPRSQKGNEPGSLLNITDPDAKVGEFSAASIDPTAFDTLLRLLSFVTDVPLFRITGNDWPSGVALLQAESNLNTRIENHQAELTTGYVDLYRLSMRLSNLFGTTSFDAEADIDIQWFPPQVETEDLRLDILTKTAQALTQFNTAGALSVDTMVRTAMRLVNPMATEEEIQAEIARVKAEKGNMGL